MKNYTIWQRAILVLLLAMASAGTAQTVSGTFKVVCVANPGAQDVTHSKACLERTPQLHFHDVVTLTKLSVQESAAGCLDAAWPD